MQFIIISKPIWLLNIALMIYDINNAYAYSAVHCHGVCEFDPHHCTFFRFYISLINLLIDIHAIHNHFQTNLVAEYRFNDI